MEDRGGTQLTSLSRGAGALGPKTHMNTGMPDKSSLWGKMRDLAKEEGSKPVLPKIMVPQK